MTLRRRVSPDALASMMIDLQNRAEAGEGTSRLISSMASLLVKRHSTRTKRR